LTVSISDRFLSIGPYHKTQRGPQQHDARLHVLANGRHQLHASFREMLATLRSESQQQYISQLSLLAQELQKIKQTLKTLAQLNI